MTSGKPTDGQEQPTRGQGPADHNVSEAQPQTSGSSAESEVQVASDCKKAACKKHRDWHDCATLALEAVGLLALMIYTTFAALQWCANKRAADAATVAAEIARKTLVASQRPWVGIVQAESFVPFDLTIDPVPNQDRQEIKIYSRITLRNHGTSPALTVIAIPLIAPNDQNIEGQIRAACTMADETAQGTFRFPISTPKLKRGQVLFPQETWSQPQTTATQVQALPPTAKLLGCIAYTDEFKEWHHTRFCFEAPLQRVVASRNISVCNAYNDAD